MLQNYLNHIHKQSKHIVRAKTNSFIISDFRVFGTLLQPRMTVGIQLRDIIKKLWKRLHSLSCSAFATLLLLRHQLYFNLEISLLNCGKDCSGNHDWWLIILSSKKNHQRISFNWIIIIKHTTLAKTGKELCFVSDKSSSLVIKIKSLNGSKKIS